MPKSLLIAAQVQGAGFGRRMRTVLLPLLHGSVVSAVLAAFGGSVFNLAITTILYPPNYSTLPVYISDSYNDLKFGYAGCRNHCGRCIYYRDYADFGILDESFEVRYQPSGLCRPQSAPGTAPQKQAAATASQVIRRHVPDPGKGTLHGNFMPGNIRKNEETEMVKYWR